MISFLSKFFISIYLTRTFLSKFLKSSISRIKFCSIVCCVELMTSVDIKVNQDCSRRFHTAHFTMLVGKSSTLFLVHNHICILSYFNTKICQKLQYYSTHSTKQSLSLFRTKLHAERFDLEILHKNGIMQKFLEQYTLFIYRYIIIFIWFIFDKS